MQGRDTDASVLPYLRQRLVSEVLRLASIAKALALEENNRVPLLARVEEIH